MATQQFSRRRDPHRTPLDVRSTIGGDVSVVSDVSGDSVLVQPQARRLDRDAGLDLRDVLLRAAAT